jgi:hypothetical protein
MKLFHYMEYGICLIMMIVKSLYLNILGIKKWLYWSDSFNQG